MHHTRSLRLLGTAAALIVVVASATECAARPAAPPTPTPPRTTTTTAPRTAPTTQATTTSRADSGVSNGQTFAVTTASITGTTPDGRGRWNAQVGQVSGGNPGVSDAFNRASDASGRGQIEQMRAEASPDMEWLFEATPTVTFRPIAIAEVIVGVYSAKEAAHPNNYVSTVVIDSRSAKPITLSDLFANQQNGLNRLSAQTKLIFPQVYGGGPSPMPDEPGNKPTPENFANWIPTSAGLEIHFNDYQFGHGLPVITVPWSALTDVLAPNMMAVTHD